MSEKKGKQIPEHLLETVQGGVSVTLIEGDALHDLEQRLCPSCKQSLKFENERSLHAGSGTTLKYFVCYNCARVFEQRVYSSGILVSEWGEVKA